MIVDLVNYIEKTNHRGHRGALRVLLPTFTVDHSLDSVAQVEGVEVDQEAYADSAQAHVGKKLGSVDWMDCVHGFHFDNHSAFND